MVDGKHDIVVLLGAGFSKPAGLPLAKEINSYFLRDNAETLLSFLSGEWKWMDFANETYRSNGKLGYNYFSYGFILNQWVNSFIEHQKEFSNYEDFYQFIIDNYRSQNILDPIYLLAFDALLKYHPSIASNPFFRSYTLALTLPQNHEILNLINHLISDLLHSRRPIQELLPAYSPFIGLIQNFEKVHLVTLNHDLLLESIMHEEGMEYSDGYSYEHSPLRLDQGKNIKFFNNEFSHDISVIKLHGSIDVYKFVISKQDGFLLQLTSDYLYFKTWDYYEKQMPVLVNPENGEVLQDFHSNITPQFITGTRKDEMIATDTMYASLYSEFDKRIHSSQNLLVIGYSFMDEHVNKKIISAINSGVTTKVVNVNPYQPFPYTSDHIEIVNLRSISELSNSFFDH